MVFITYRLKKKMIEKLLSEQNSKPKEYAIGMYNKSIRHKKVSLKQFSEIVSSKIDKQQYK